MVTISKQKGTTVANDIEARKLTLTQLNELKGEMHRSHLDCLFSKFYEKEFAVEF